MHFSNFGRSRAKSPSSVVQTGMILSAAFGAFGALLTLNGFLLLVPL